ncbi:MAG: M18 family aminopeptidase [Eggerthellaceae bacterium]|jgi:aspartyl aminopeptidase
MDSRDLQVSQRLLNFIADCPSMFHTVATIRERLENAGFTYLPEADAWTIRPGGVYFTVRNNSSLIAFAVGSELGDGTLADDADPGYRRFGQEVPGGFHFQLAACHADSPTYKVKAVPELSGPGSYLRLNVESYGGVVDSTWLDRPLSLAGRVLVRNGTGIESRLLSIDRDVLLIPNVAIHLSHNLNNNPAYNRQVDLCPLFSAGELDEGSFKLLIAEELGADPAEILGWDLFLVNRQGPRIWGAADEFISSPRLDDLQGTFCCLESFLAADNPACITVFSCFDNEEVGSGTKQGALSTFLSDTLERITGTLGGSEEDYHRALAKSFMISCDNAHAVHPNHPEKTDEANRAWLNQGIVIKEAANQKYTTDAFSRSVFAALCEREGIPYQRFANRSDLSGGSTLGNLSNRQVSVHAVDVGLPQLAMHSAYETAGIRDTALAIQALTAFYRADIQIAGADAARIG